MRFDWNFFFIFFIDSFFCEEHELLGGCSSTLEIFLEKHICILFFRANIIFSTLTKNGLKIFKLEKSLK